VVAEKDAHARLTSDAYLGQQCMAAEVVGGLVRGIKYWAAHSQLQAQQLVREVLDFVVSIPEMESAGVWASGLRFAIFDRHPSRISWVMEYLFDEFPAYHVDTAATLVCRRIVLLKPIINELSWRGSPLHRQLLHDVEPYLASPFTQTRDYASSAVGLIARVTWSPAWSEQAPRNSANHTQGDGGGGGERSPVSAENSPVSAGKSPGQNQKSPEKSPVSVRQSPVCRRASSHWGITKGGEWTVSSPSYNKSPVDGDTPEILATRTPLCPAEALHHIVARLCARMTSLASIIARARKRKGDGEGVGGGGGGGRGGENGVFTGGVGGGKEGGREGGGEGGETALKRETETRETETSETALKRETDELKHLRHSLIQIVSGMCPNFDGMYTCPLGKKKNLKSQSPSTVLLESLVGTDFSEFLRQIAPHLPALLLPLLQSLEDRDEDLTRQAKRCAELSANTPMLPGNVLPQVYGLHVCVCV
jgi:hypothetical protein